MRKKTASQVICENFKIPPQTIFQDYKCTYKSSVMFFGRIYIGEQHFLFIANMFGLVKKCTITLDSITKIQYNSQSNIIIISSTQNVKGVQEIVDYAFGSFKNDNAYKLMMALWKGEKVQSDILIKQREEQNQKFDATQKIIPSDMLDQGQVEANFFNAQAVQTQKQKIVQIQLPCSIKQFYEFFIADNASVYNRKKHLQCRNSREITVTPWRNNQELKSDVREINAIIKVSGVPLMKEAGMSQVWMLKHGWDQNEMHLNVVTQMSDVPYSSYFNCEQHISINKQGDKKCRMIVYASVVFNKSTYMKGKILTRTFGDMKQQYQFWYGNVKQKLQKMKRQQQSHGSDEGKAKNIGIEYEKSIPLNDTGMSQQINVKIKSSSETKTLQIIRNSFSKKSENKFSLEQKVDAIIILIFILLLVSLTNLFHQILF